MSKVAPAPSPPPPPVYGVSTTIETMPGVIPIVNFQKTPIQCSCQFCRSNIVTSTTYESGILTWVACIIIALFGCWLGCCLIPFCVNPCKDVTHTCPDCHQQMGIYKRI